jgi:hypothetical protein
VSGGHGSDAAVAARAAGWWRPWRLHPWIAFVVVPRPHVRAQRDSHAGFHGLVVGLVGFATGCWLTHGAAPAMSDKAGASSWFQGRLVRSELSNPKRRQFGSANSALLLH